MCERNRIWSTAFYVNVRILGVFSKAIGLCKLNFQITSEEVVSAYIERCKEANPYLNAIVEPRYDQALREARSIDKMIASTDRTPEQLEKEYPLLGVPITVKESIAVEGNII